MFIIYKWAIFCGYVKSSEGKHGFVEMVMLDFSNGSTFGEFLPKESKRFL
jgi:hypothetical protein